MSPADPRRARALDSLRRLADAAGLEAARAVGRLVGREVPVEQARLVDGPDAAGVARILGRPDEELVAIAMDLQQPAGGRLLLVAAADDAERVSEKLVPGAAAGSLDVVGESALVELANIAGSAFVSAMAQELGRRLLHGVPRLTRGRPRACLVALAPGAAGPAVGVRIGCPGTSGTLLLLPDAALVDGLLDDGEAR